MLVVGSDKIDGFETGQWQAALDRAGYPKSAPPGRKPAPQTAASPGACVTLTIASRLPARLP